MSIVPTMFAALQDGTLLFYAAREGYTTCVEHLLSTPGIDVDTAFQELFNDFIKYSLF